MVVGAGLAGLAAAARLASGGIAVTVLEAAGAVGGRARTIDVGGRPADLGFQSIFTAYPEASAFLREIGLRERDLVRFQRGGVFHDGIEWQQMSLGPRALHRFAAFTTGDVLRLGRLAAEVRASSPAALLGPGRDEEAIEDHLRRRGFSGRAIEGFFRPLFGVITLDPSLSSDAGYFGFLMRMLVSGDAAIPVEGHGMIGRWAAEFVAQRGGLVRTGAAVRELRLSPDGRADGVVLATGEVVAGDAVVVAASAAGARELVGPHDPVAGEALDLVPAGVTTLIYELDRPFHHGKTIVLNAAPRGEGARIDLLCQESNLTRPGKGAPYVLLATSVHGGGEAPGVDWLEGEMARLVGRWSPGFDWGRHARLREAVVHPAAQFLVPPGVRRSLPGPRTRLSNVVLAGDFTHHPSIEGAVASGRQAADIVSALRA